MRVRMLVRGRDTATFTKWSDDMYDVVITEGEKMELRNVTKRLASLVYNGLLESGYERSVDP